MPSSPQLVRHVAFEPLRIVSPLARRSWLALLVVAALAAPAHAVTDECRAGGSALSDAKDIAGVRGAIARACPCAAFDGSPGKTHGRFLKCAKTVIADAVDSTPLLGAFTLRKVCKSEVKKIYSKAACGYPAAEPRVMCCEAKTSSGLTKAKAERVAKCVDEPNGKVVRHACYASPFAPDACSFDTTNSCTTLV